MLRAGIFGAGFIAEAHAATYAALDNVELAMVADPRHDRAERLAGRYGARGVASVEELLRSDVDVVSICVPTPFHAEVAIAALQAGKHVLCEKPIARTVAQAEAMIVAAQVSGMQLMVGHVSRYEPDHRRAYELLQRGDIGELRMASQSITGPFPEWSSGGWFADVSQSGGPVLDLAIHSFDYLLWIFGRRVRRVAAVGARRGGTVHAYALVTLTFDDGSLGMVETSWAHPKAQGLTARTELLGTRGRLAWDYDDIAGMQVINEAGGKRNLLMVGEHPFGTQIADFLRCIEQGLPVPIPGVEALDALRIALAALESLETGRMMDLIDPAKQERA